LDSLYIKLNEAGVYDFQSHYTIYYGRSSPTEGKLQLIKDLKKVLTVKETSMYICLIEYFANQEVDYFLSYLKAKPMFKE
jgi:hypothetical protein